METTIVYWSNLGIMENRVETTIVNWMVFIYNNHLKPSHVRETRLLSPA